MDFGKDGYSEEEKESPVFHYKQGDFRKREDVKLRELALGINQPKRGLFRSLVNTRGNRFMFFTLIAVTVLCFTIGFLSSSRETSTLKNTKLSLSSFSFEDGVYVTLEFSPSKKSDKPAVNDFNIEFRAVNKEKAVCEKSEQFYVYENKKGGDKSYIYQKFKDYDIIKVECEVSADDETVILESSVVHKR
ncbi:MAG: hypothetical protein J5780_02975 [Treponema sp.]|nr:hypothetical protein [Treponema sp.]